MKNKPFNKKDIIGSLGSDLSTTIQNFHYSGELDSQKNDNLKNKRK